jgi:hypothetical protein
MLVSLPPGPLGIDWRGKEKGMSVLAVMGNASSAEDHGVYAVRARTLH